MTIILLLVGLGLIVLGADWLVDGASAIARLRSLLLLSICKTIVVELKGDKADKLISLL